MDRQVRYPRDPAPLVPGTATRLRWPSASEEHQVRMIRERVQEGGRHLYVLRPPYDTSRGDVILAECHYPDTIQPEYFPWLDPYRQADARMGRLVLIACPDYEGTVDVGRGIRVLAGGVTEPVIEEIREFNRDARAHLKRQSSAHARRLEMDERHRKEFEESQVTKDWEDFYVDAVLETRKFAMNKPRVSVGADIS